MNGSVDKKFWNKKKVFITGHTGFKGSWLSLWLTDMGAVVKGFSLEPPTNPSLFIEANLAAYLDTTSGDIRDSMSLKRSFEEFEPEIVFHLAAQPLVEHAYLNPVETIETNIMGTVNLLEVVRENPKVRALINITTDKVYENLDWVWGYRETDRLGGNEPYSSSKSCSELLTNAYRNSYFKKNSKPLPLVASARAGNVIGGGDWTKTRLIPDVLDAFEKGVPAIIRNPHATRPWQHVLEPLSGYMMLAQQLYHGRTDYDTCWNFGPNQNNLEPVSWVVDQMAKLWDDKTTWETKETEKYYEARSLKLDISKSTTKLLWSPKFNTEEALKLTVEWYKGWACGDDARKLCLEQIKKFQTQ